MGGLSSPMSRSVTVVHLGLLAGSPRVKSTQVHVLSPARSSLGIPLVEVAHCVQLKAISGIGNSNSYTWSVGKLWRCQYLPQELGLCLLFSPIKLIP